MTHILWENNRKKMVEVENFLPQTTQRSTAEGKSFYRKGREGQELNLVFQLPTYQLTQLPNSSPINVIVATSQRCPTHRGFPGCPWHIPVVLHYQEGNG
jgi:G:T/U-mismatch repair DNA glycosylase